MSKLVALTFDDGHSNTTPKILDILESEKIPGSFFLIGNNISEETKPLFERQIALGCEICNHSLTHSDMTTLTAEEIASEIKANSEKIYSLCGKTPKFFRPPYLCTDDKMFDNIPLTFIAGADSHDWEAQLSPEGRIANILELVRDGAIILMHDFADNDNTVKALPTVIAELRKLDYEFVTVSELFERKGIEPYVKGKVWSYVE